MDKELQIISETPAPNEITIDEIVGTYKRKHVLTGYSLTLEADGRFFLGESSCTDYIHSSGIYVCSRGVLHFTFLKCRGGNHMPLKNEVGLPIPKGEFKLIPLKWGDRIYLISEKTMVIWAYAVNKDFEPRPELNPGIFSDNDNFYLRAGDEQKPVNEPPLLPHQWLALFRSETITATIVSIEEDEYGDILTIDKGSENGVKVHMHMFAKEANADRLIMTAIIGVEENSSKAKVNVKPKPSLCIGDKVNVHAEPSPSI